MIKNLFAVLFVALIFILPSCNEDDTTNDPALTSKLKGTWVSSTTSDEETLQTTLALNSDFSFRCTSTTIDNKTFLMKTWSVGGAWNVRKEILQMNYDIETLTGMDMSEEEMTSIRTILMKNNSVLAESNKNGRPYGHTILFESVNGEETLQLSGFTGYFTQMK